MRTLVLALLCAAAAFAQADLVLRNGKIVTMEAAHPTAEAMAVRNGVILVVGSDADVKALTGPKTRVIDLSGKLAIPGFIEGHGHFMGVGQYRMNLNLRNARNWDEIVAMVAAAAKTTPPGAWILGRGWHQSKWDKTPAPNVQGFPVHADLSKVSPNNPVRLTHASGHASMVNAQALKQAEISGKRSNPAGGEILKDAQGQPTGLLQERAQQLLDPAYNAYKSKMSAAELEAEARKEIELATDECLANGITSFQDAGSSLQTIDLFRKEAEAGELRLRLWVMIRDGYNSLTKNLARYRIIEAGDRRLTVRAIKKQMDGALGSRGAWLIEAYSDLPTSTGLNTEPISDIRKTAELAITNGFQLCIHAIGDRANREVLNLYESVFREHPDKAQAPNDLRWRDEHTQHVNAADIPRFAKLGVIASMQAIHCTSDAPYVLPRRGRERAKEGAYVWRSLIDSGAIVTNGTDAPVEEVSPIASFYAAVSRKLKDGTRFYPEQRMTREEALRSYTLNNAYAAFEEKSKGSLAPGKMADITVLSQDIMTIAEDAIPATQVVYTIVGGKIAYSK